jgi:uncharacterized protein (TIGR02284 family)
MQNEEAVDVLNNLIEINNDRIEGYETASKETKEDSLSSMFSRFIETSLKCREELTEEVERLGGTPVEGTKISGKFFRAWMDVKAALTGNDHKAILDSCEYGEETALETYDKALRDDSEHLSIEQRDMIDAQREMIKADYDEIKELKDQLVERD